LGDPGYRFTTGHKTLVWSELPGQDNTMTWSGSRDEEGYATGDGSLTFYRVNWKRVTGSNIPAGKPIMARRLTGRMARGKFRGVVEMTTAEGITTHAKFADGVPAGKWLEGEAPDTTKTKAIAQQQAAPKEEKNSAMPIPAPAEGPSTTIEINRPEAVSSKVEEATVQHPPAESDQLRSLTAPPSSLPKTDSRLSRAEVIRAADEEAIRRGLNVGDYQSRKTNYNSSAATWTVSYDQSSGKSGSDGQKHFTVTVEDKTSKASVTPDE
jgi:hypothetical protein